MNGLNTRCPACNTVTCTKCKGRAHAATLQCNDLLAQAWEEYKDELVNPDECQLCPPCADFIDEEREEPRYVYSPFSIPGPYLYTRKSLY